MKKQLVEGLVAVLVGVILGWALLRSLILPLDVPPWHLAIVGGVLLASVLVLWTLFGLQPSRRTSVTARLRDNAGVYILALAFILGIAVFYASVLETQPVPAWVFANRVPYDEAVTRLDIVNLEGSDLSGVQGLGEALREAEPFRPVRVSGLEGRAIFDLLGGEETDVIRARVKGIVYVYSVQLGGEYYNVCIVFMEDRYRAMVTGTHWVGALKYS